MADVQQTYEFKFEFDRKDIKKQLKEISGDVKDAIAQMGDASDKVVIFKDLVAYLSNVDKALEAFKTKHKDDFDNLFGNPDKDILGVLTEIFNTTQKSAQAFVTLKDKIAAAQSSNADLKTLRGIAEEMNALFVSLGQTPRINISELFEGKGSKDKGTDFEGRIKILNDALAEFGVVYSGVQDKLKNGFNFGGGASGSGAGDKTISEIDAMIERLKQKNKELLEAKEVFQKTLDEFNDAGNGISDTHKIDLTEESIRGLVSEYDALQTQLQSTKASSADYYDTLTKLVTVSLKLKRALKDVNADAELKNGFMNISAGVSGESNLLGLLSTYASRKNPITPEIEKVIKSRIVEGTVNRNNALISELENDGDITSMIQKRIDLYNKLKRKIEEYHEESMKDFETDEEEDVSLEKLAKIEQEIKTLTKTKKNVDDISAVLGNLGEEGQTVDSVLKQLYKTLGMELPDSFIKRMESLQAEAQKIIDMAASASEGASSAGSGGAGIPGSGDGGNGGGAGSGSGGSSGGGGGQPITDIDFTSLENTIKSEAANIGNKLDNNIFKVELVKDSTDNVNDVASKIQTSVSNIESAINVIKNTNVSPDTKNDHVNVLRQAIEDILTMATQLELDIANKGIDGKESMYLIGGDGLISTTQGADYQLDIDTLVRQLVENLRQGVIMSLHNHAHGMQAFSPADLKTFANLYYGQGSKINGIIAGGLIKTIDFTKISQELALKVAESYENNVHNLAKKYPSYLSYQDGHISFTDTIQQLQNVNPAVFEQLVSALVNEINDCLNQAFTQNELNPSIQEFSIHSISKLAEYINGIQLSSENAIDPVKKLQTLLSSLYPNKTFNWQEYTDLFEKLRSGQIDGLQAFKQITEPSQFIRETKKTIVTEGQTLAEQPDGDAINTDTEIESLELLRSKLLEVRSAIEDKTNAFEAEQTTVDTVVTAEVGYLDNLIAKLSEIVNQIGLIESGFNRINTNVPNVDTNAQNKLAGNPHFLTDPNGNVVTAYRGIRGAFGGLVSNRYHGGTFSTDNLNIAKTYAGAAGKVEKVNLIMDNPFEIDGKGAKWNEILYLGNGADETSKELLALSREIEHCSYVINAFGSTTEEIQQAMDRLDVIGNRMNEIFADNTNPYGVKNTNEIVELVQKKGGYDGVIFKNIIDTADAACQEAANVIVTFNAEQIHYLGTITASFGEALDMLRTEWGDFDKYIDLTTDDIASIVKEFYNLGDGDPSDPTKLVPINQKQLDFIENNPILKAYHEKMAKLYEVPAWSDTAYLPPTSSAEGTTDSIIRFQDTVSSYFKHVQAQFNTAATTVEEYDKEKGAVNQNLEQPTVNDAVAGQNSNVVGEEVQRLTQLQSKLAEVKNAILEKTKAFYDEGTIVGQAVGKEIAALTKLLEIIDKIAPKVEYLTNGFRDLESQSTNIKDENTSGSKEAPSRDPFKQQKYNQKSAFNEYREGLQNVDYLTDEVNKKLNDLAVDFEQVDDKASLEKWKAEFAAVKDEVDVLRVAFEKTSKQDVAAATGLFNSVSKLGFLNSTTPLTAEQQEILDLREKLGQEVTQYNKAIEKGKKIELDSINATMQALQEKIFAYKEANDLVNSNNKTGKNFGANAVSLATGKYNNIKDAVNSEEFKNSTILSGMFKSYEASYNRLLAKRKELAQVEGPLTSTQIAEFNQLKTECAQTAKAIEDIIKASNKLKNAPNMDKFSSVGADFEDNAEGRKAALSDFVQQMYGVSVAAEDFQDNYTKCVWVVDNGDGTFTQMTATFDKARNTIVATSGEIKKTTTFLGSLFDEIKGKFRTIFTYLTASMGWQEVFQQLRKGVQYVREIDTALTELKKVTDETDASYKQFLQTMSQTADKIGSTVKDLTNSAADWARLGYTMQEAGELAKNTSILMNVSEFQDVNTATDSMISALQAFKTEGVNVQDLSMEIINAYNEVGNNYAISTSDLASSLTRSSAALVAANNSLAESIAMTTAANTTIQDPESVGNALKVVSMRIRGKLCPSIMKIIVCVTQYKTHSITTI